MRNKILLDGRKYSMNNILMFKTIDKRDITGKTATLHVTNRMLCVDIHILIALYII